MQANYANALCHLNPTPLSVAVLAPCAWSGKLATRQIRLGKCGEMGGACGRNGQSENGAVFGRGTSLSLSLVARTFWHINFFKHFIFGLLRPFCHFERSEKSKEFKIRFVYGYFADAQYELFVSNIDIW